VRELSEDDVDFETMRAGGPGGQHGDRRATAVRLRISIDDLPLSDTEKRFVRKNLPPKNKTNEGELIVEYGGTRSQQRNRKKSLKIAVEEIETAIKAGVESVKSREHKQRNRGPSGGGGGGGHEDIEETQKKRRRSETTDDLLDEALQQDPEILDRFDETEEDQDEND
jgi:protein subunit release factor B